MYVPVWAHTCTYLSCWRTVLIGSPHYVGSGDSTHRSSSSYLFAKPFCWPYSFNLFIVKIDLELEDCAQFRSLVWLTVYKDIQIRSHVCAFSPLGLDQGVDMYHVSVVAYFCSLFVWWYWHGHQQWNRFVVFYLLPLWVNWSRGVWWHSGQVPEHSYQEPLGYL